MRFQVLQQIQSSPRFYVLFVLEETHQFLEKFRFFILMKVTGMSTEKSERFVKCMLKLCRRESSQWHEETKSCQDTVIAKLNI